MPKDTKETACVKKSYETRDAAGFFANADGLSPYRCPRCSKWHLTSERKQLEKFRGKVYAKKMERLSADA